ncbi:MAG: hypothetical protein QNJ46_24520 [Leptolyngbyaceae cyanobacterium MO_188.B28]|nr:hypothetical protein [Leptolyngbyaceae cyanobacterium MO_188.B28]
MIKSINDISSQARQGSVAAIIQVLNEQLADAGIRTRAFLAQNILQLLCEAAKPEQLEQTVVVERVREILENLSPRHIRRVKIYSRIVREHQLLWLEEVTQDAENQLLWSELITLKRPNLFKRLAEDLRTPKPKHPIPHPPAARPLRPRKNTWRWVLGGVSFCVLLGIVGWPLKSWLQSILANSSSAGTAQNGSEVQTTAKRTFPAGQDPFAQAVRMANQAVVDGRSAESSADWLELAAEWQRASDLMAEVPADHPRFQEAQVKIVEYHNNSEISLAQSERIQAESAELYGETEE